jgi:hypothetical protein
MPSIPLIMLSTASRRAMALALAVVSDAVASSAWLSIDSRILFVAVAVMTGSARAEQPGPRVGRETVELVMSTVDWDGEGPNTGIAGRRTPPHDPTFVSLPHLLPGIGRTHDQHWSAVIRSG